MLHFSNIHFPLTCQIGKRKCSTPPSSPGCIDLLLPVQRSASCFLELWGLDTPLRSRAPPQRKVWIPFPICISAVLKVQFSPLEPSGLYILSLCEEEMILFGLLKHFYVVFFSVVCEALFTSVKCGYIE